MSEDSEPIVEPVFLTPAELVQRWRGIYTEKTLTNWRGAGGGPKFVRIANRILYDLEDVRLFERPGKSSRSRGA